MHISPFRVEFWLGRVNPSTGMLYTEEEAKSHIRSFRKTNVEYYIVRGASEQEAEKMVADFQKRSGKMAAQYIMKHPECRSTNVSYWINRGYDVESAKKILSDRQTTFSRQKCIEKYGERGDIIWKERQKKWMDTMRRKSPEEKLDINKRKNAFRRFYSKDAVRDSSFFSDWRSVCESKNMMYIEDKEVAIMHIKRLFSEDPLNKFRGFDYFLQKECPAYLYRIFGMSKKEIRDILEMEFGECKPVGYKIETQKIARYCRPADGRILKSSLEMYFYDLCKTFGLKIDGIDEKYPNSSMRYDFLVHGMFIETAGMMEYERYRNKIMYKIETFNCVVLVNRKEIYDFVFHGLVENDNTVIAKYTNRHFG